MAHSRRGISRHKRPSFDLECDHTYGAPCNCDREYRNLISEAENQADNVVKFLQWIENWKEMSDSTLRSLRISVDVADLRTSTESNLNKIHRKNLHLSIFGSTSAGKSTMVNLLIGRLLLPSSANRCTPCCILVQGTSEAESFYTIDDNDERFPISTLEREADKLKSPTTSYRTIHVFVALSGSREDEDERYLDLNRMQLSLMDTPGFDQPAFEENKQAIMESDVFVFVVDSQVGLNERMTEFFKFVTQTYGHAHILVVFNKWDLVFEEGSDRAGQLRSSYLREARKFLREFGTRKTGEAGKKEIDDAMLDRSIFVFSSTHIKTMRATDHFEKIQRVIFEAAASLPAESPQKVFVCGGSAAGRYSVANLLLGKTIIPSKAGGTDIFVSIERRDDGGASIIEDGSSEHQLADLSCLLSKGSSDVRLLLSQEDLPSASWPQQLRLVACPHWHNDGFVERTRALMGTDACTLVIAITDQHSPQNLRQRIEKSLEPLSVSAAHNIVLVVNELPEAPAESHVMDRSEMVKVFVECCTSFQRPELSRQRVFFICLHNLERQRESLSEFQRFNATLLEEGSTNFKATKFEPIFEALEKCSVEALARLEVVRNQLDAKRRRLSAARPSLDAVLLEARPDLEPGRVERALVEIETFEAQRGFPVSAASRQEAWALVVDFVSFLRQECLEKEQDDLRRGLRRHLSLEDMSDILDCLTQDERPSVFEPSQNAGVQSAVRRYEAIIGPLTLSQSIALGSQDRLWPAVKRSAAYGGLTGGLFVTAAFLDPAASRPKRLGGLLASMVAGAVAGAAVGFVQNCPRHSSLEYREGALRQLLVDVHCLWRQHVLNACRSVILQRFYTLENDAENARRKLATHWEQFRSMLHLSREERARRELDRLDNEET